jgi:DNA-binding IclR family transcriptional regulator
MKGGEEVAKINSIDRAIDILSLIYDNNREMGISEIARELNVYKSTVFRTLETLEERGFVTKNENSKYWLGIKLYALGSVAGKSLPFKNLIQPYARAVSEKFNEVVNVSILDETTIDFPTTILIIKETAVNHSLITANPPLGASSKAHYSAVGKCLLAYTHKSKLDNYKCYDLPVYTENTISNWDDLMEELEKVRKVGYAMDNEDYEIGLTCIAVPILDGNNKAVAAMSVSGPSKRMRQHDYKTIISLLQQTSNEISKRLN